MCEDLKDALDGANNNINSLAKKISALKIPCEYKGVFMKMADSRGFRFTNDTLEQMETIGKAKSSICLDLLNRSKLNGLIVPYTLATQLGSDKERALVLQVLQEKKQKITELNVVKAILTIQHRLPE